MKILWLCLALLCAGCAYRSKAPELVSINLIDREGMSETVTNDERLKRYVDVDFLTPQPYLKVLRVYKTRDSSLIPAYVTSYHPNGQLRQYLEVVNGRAYGLYQEWYPNGVQKLEAKVIGGMADVTSEAEKSWLFDGICQVWNEEGGLQATIPYDKGVLVGSSTYYYPSGSVSKIIPYDNGQLNGVYQCYREDGLLLLTAEYQNSRLSGLSQAFWEDGSVAYEETYCNQRLLSGTYFDQTGRCLAQVKEGKGWRAFATPEGWEFQEFRSGKLEGEVKSVDPQGVLLRSYSMKNGLKNGQEIIYVPQTDRATKPQPKVSISWVDATMHGLVKTWYEEGGQESQREMCKNLKNGLLSAWYKDGNLMLIEEYDNGKLIKGKYYRKSEKQPVSKVIGGRGLATIFDGDGNLLRKTNYNNGSPSD